jgi:hypothetical protein
MIRILLCLLASLSLAHAQAEPKKPALAVGKQALDGSVWGGLFYAKSGAAQAVQGNLPSGLKNVSERLSKAFPLYSNFELIGQQQQDIMRQYESWVVPSRDIFLKLDSKGHDEAGGLKLGLQFWREQQILVKTDLVLQKNSPLFIGGPKWREGQVIFVLLLTKEK